MPKSLSTAYLTSKILFPYRKSRLLNTMVTADFGPKPELTLYCACEQKISPNHWGNIYR